MTRHYFADFDLNNQAINNATGVGGGGGSNPNLLLLNGLGSWYTLDEASGTRFDSHSNGLNLDDNNTVTSQTGLIGDEAVFVRANQEYLSHPNTGTIYQYDPSFTWSGWVTFDNLTNTQQVANVYLTSGNQRKWQVEYSLGDGKLAFWSADDGITPSNLLSVTTPTATVRFHLAISYDNATNTRSIYINGVLDAQDNPGSPGLFTSTTALYGLGARPGNPSATALDGKIDEAAYWSRALSLYEVELLYNSGSGITYSDLTAGSGSGGGSSSTRVIDTFTDTNGTAITAHSPDSGGITWLEHNIISSGSFTPPIADIQSNALQWIEDNTIAYFDGGSPDGQINVKLTPQVAAGGDAPIIILKKGTEGNQVEIFLRENDDTIIIQERISDVSNVLASISYAFAESVEYAISVNFSGLGGSLTVTPQENPLTNPTEPITLSFNIDPALVDNQNVGLASGDIPIATRFDSFSFKAC